MLKVERVVTGFLDENCYIVHNGNECLVIDPGSDINKIVTNINRLLLVVKGVLITHYHSDHVGCLDYMKDVYKVPVIDYKNAGDVVIDSFNFKVIETFGHTMDSCSFYFDKDSMLFSGDFIFKGTIGNIEDECEEEMFKSLKSLKFYPEKVIIYPGHEEQTTVGEELKNNPYFRGI